MTTEQRIERESRTAYDEAGKIVGYGIYCWPASRYEARVRKPDGTYAALESTKPHEIRRFLKDHAHRVVLDNDAGVERRRKAAEEARRHDPRRDSSGNLKREAQVRFGV